METLSNLWSGQSFMPHGHCYLWTPAMVWLQVATNGLIGLSYVVISLTLIVFRRRVVDLPFRFIYLAFGVFIIACGFTHFIDIWVIWQPRYWLDVAVRALTAIASVGTAAVLPRYVPQAARLAQSIQHMRREGVELEAAMNDLGSLYRRTRELDELKTNFFANVSHELRTPLTLILAPLSSVTRRDDLPSDVQQELDGVLRNARLLSSLVNDLLDIQKLDAGKLSPRYSAVDLSRLVHDTAAHFESLSRERGVIFAVDTPIDLPVQVDAEKMRRVILNLLSNAFKYTPPGGKVWTELTLGPDRGDASRQACLRVTDTGPGIPEGERDRLFERFSQGSADARGAAGTGLGLSIVRELVQLHGGSVELERSASGGASFVVLVPLLAPPGSNVAVQPCLPALAIPDLTCVIDAAAPAAQVADPATSDDPRISERPSVLLVEDNPDMRRLLRELLSDRYRVIEAEDGAQALSQLRDHQPDLILSDMMMPRVSGEQLLHAVRAMSTFDRLPFLLLTAKADEQLRSQMLRSGAQDYLIKPFEPEELLARVHNLVSMHRAQVLLQHEVEAQQADVEVLTRSVLAQKRQLEAALSLVSAAREQAENASRQKTDFLSLVSHELRTPLASIRLQLERLTRGLTGPITAKQSDVIHRIARSNSRLSEMVESLLQFNRIESGRLVPSQALLDLGAVAHEVVDELRGRAETKALTLRVECHDDGVAVASDPQLVRLILVNLCDNAIKYTSEGEIVVAIDRDPKGAVRLRVTDTGPGIAFAARERVFQPFEQLENVRYKRGAGVGLGLALVKRIAEALEAEVDLESAEGAGSRFSVTFPLQPPPALGQSAG